MNAASFKLRTVLCGLVVCSVATFARGQAAGGASGVTPGQVRQEVRQLANDLQDPNFDYSKAPERMREVFQDFRAATDSMDPGQAQQFRQEMFQQIGPILAANQQKIQDAIRLSFLKSLQQPLGCSDEEFAAIRPYLEKVVDASQAAQVNRFGGRNGPGGTPPSNVKQSAVQQAAADLQATLNDANASGDLIKNKLDLLRQAQDKAKQDLNVARSQLQALLTERQEAVLVEYGLLD